MQENLNIAMFIKRRRGGHAYPLGSQFGGLVAEPTISSLHKGHPTNSQDCMKVYQIKSQLKKGFLRNYNVIEMYTTPSKSPSCTATSTCPPCIGCLAQHLPRTLPAGRALCYPLAPLPEYLAPYCLLPACPAHPTPHSPCTPLAPRPAHPCTPSSPCALLSLLHAPRPHGCAHARAPCWPLCAAARSRSRRPPWVGFEVEGFWG
jgi:hypothetical protein